MSFDLFLLILVLIAGFYMAWNIGANDVSNAMGTSVGSGALTLTKAVLIAGVLEFCGAFFLGAHVSETVQKGLVDPEVFATDPTVLLYGMLSALIATALWLQTASYFGWPVSTTHAIVGAILGFGALIGGVHAVEWWEVGRIAASWVISPVLSGIMAFLIFSFLQRSVLYAFAPVAAAKRFVPIFAALLFFTFAFSILAKGMGNLKFNLSTKEGALLSLVIAVIVFFAAKLIIRKQNIALKEQGTPNDLHNVYSLKKAMKHLQG